MVPLVPKKLAVTTPARSVAGADGTRHVVAPRPRADENTGVEDRVRARWRPAIGRRADRCG